MKKWTYGSFFFLVLIICLSIGTAGILADDSPNKEITKEQFLQPGSHVTHHPPVAELQKPEVTEMLNEAWTYAKSRMKQSKKLSIEDWATIDYGDIDIAFTNELTREEAFSFTQAVYHEERINNRQYGDTSEAILLAPEKDEAYLIWKRKNHNVVYLHLVSTAQADGTRTWDVNGKAVEIDASPVP
ncbi:hypothetical protein [Marinicrinis sediminis]|uniref:Uncharacterized protein n=1 Tax=Marinicrinis sediminis TaxID=1652465 RepID=A0ABW5RB04_9BACL